MSGNYFNSRPHEEIDAFYRCLINVLVISTHDLARRSTTEFYDLGLGSSTFQLTTSRRGRLEKHTKTVPPTYFNSRPHKEVDQEIASEPTLHHISTHDLTKRSTARAQFKSSCTHNFNSRPHEEVDVSRRRHRSQLLFQLTTSQGGRLSWWKIKYTICTISTHDLARRSTGKNQLLIVSLRISTHVLARRSTRILPLILHQSPRISTHDLARRSTNHTNHPYFRIFISTHDLVRRSTILDAGAEVLKIFQLTTS